MMRAFLYQSVLCDLACAHYYKPWAFLTVYTSAATLMTGVTLLAGITASLMMTL